MSSDQLSRDGAGGGWYRAELYCAWRAASGEADDTYAHWSRTLAHNDYAVYVAATDRSDAAVAALAAELRRRRRTAALRGFPAGAGAVS